MDYGIHVARPFWRRRIGTRLLVEAAGLARRLGKRYLSVVRVLGVSDLLGVTGGLYPSTGLITPWMRLTSTGSWLALNQYVAEPVYQLQWVGMRDYSARHQDALGTILHASFTSSPLVISASHNGSTSVSLHLSTKRCSSSPTYLNTDLPLPIISGCLIKGSSRADLI